MGTGGHNVPILLDTRQMSREGTPRAYTEKSPTLNATMYKTPYSVTTESDLKYYWRKLTIKECARLQGIPDWYKFIVSNSRAYKMIGNGWQVDTIEYIFSHFNLCGK